MLRVRRLLRAHARTRATDARAPSGGGGGGGRLGGGAAWTDRAAVNTLSRHRHGPQVIGGRSGDARGERAHTGARGTASTGSASYARPPPTVPHDHVYPLRRRSRRSHRLLLTAPSRSFPPHPHSMRTSPSFP